MPTRFEPIAIVGQSCLLPGAHSPAELWRNVEQGRHLITPAPAGYWRVDPDTVMTHDRRDDDRTYSDRGGYVRGFTELFDPSGFLLPEEQVRAFDPLVQWALHTGREAWRDAHKGAPDRAAALRARTGVVLGNLSYPSRALSELAEAVWLDQQGPQFIGGRARQVAGIQMPAPINRFMSGLPAHALAQGLGLGGGAFCLDAACASSLYALKLACDRLHEGSADLMLAGGLNRADDLFIHVGFCALQAMSPTGQSRPFHRHADGLVPAEGAAFVALKRLADAERDGDDIYGVIRGIGLANDGRGRGLLVPCGEGQQRALRQAYAASGLSPSDISLVECHATGTAVGDAVEVDTLGQVFAGVKDVPVASLKSNLGHLITVSGTAALQKVLAGMRHGLRAKSLHAEEPMEALGKYPNLRVVQENEPWLAEGPRRAAVSNFGFGGNDAHVLVEEYLPGAARPVTQVSVPQQVGRERLAIVAMEVLAGTGQGLADFAQDLFSGSSRVREIHGARQARAQGTELPLLGLRFPPSDLADALPQQVMILKALWQLLRTYGELPREKTGVLVGMQCDTEVAAYGARWRMENSARRWAAALGLNAPPPGWVEEAKDVVGHQRGAAGVIGAMPNIPANRLCSQFDLAGPSFTVSAEELSGLVALELAARALQTGEMDAMVVGAVDMSAELVHRLAAEAVLPADRQVPGDAAVVMVLKRESDARAAGDTIYATFDRPELGASLGAHRDEPLLRLGLGTDNRLSLTPQLGHSHAASGLLHVAAAALACHHRASPRGKGLRANPWLPNAGAEQQAAAVVELDSLGGQHGRVKLYAQPVGRPLALAAPPALEAYAAPDGAAVLEALQAHRPCELESAPAGARLALWGPADTQEARRAAAVTRLEQHDLSVPLVEPGLAYYPAPVAGEVAWVFTGPAGAYHGMGRELLLAFPELLRDVYDPSLEQAARWIYGQDPEVPPASKLWGSSFLSQLHAHLSRDVLKIKPQAAIGFCSGESNSLFALGAWRDLAAMYREIEEGGVFTRHIGGELRMLEKAWGAEAPQPVRWVNWRIFAPVSEVEAAVQSERWARLTIVNAPGDVVVGGDPEAVARVVDRVGRSKAYPIGYDVALHCAEAKAYEGPWYEIHARETYPVPGVRFYSASTASHYQPSKEACAQAITAMAQQRVDFPRMIENAYADGVRVFIEHGPRDGCAKWISRTLGDRPHVSVALDRGGVSGVEQAVQSAVHLWAAGVEVDVRALLQHLAQGAYAQPAPIEGPTRFYDAHAAAPKLPPMVASGASALPSRSSVMKNIPHEQAAVAAASAHASSATAPSGVQRAAASMAPAPRLPPVAPHSPGLRRPSTVMASASVPPPAAHLPQPEIVGGPIAQLVQSHGALTQAHHAFLQSQAAVQAQWQRWLQAQQQLVQQMVLAQAGGGHVFPGAAAGAAPAAVYPSAQPVAAPDGMSGESAFGASIPGAGVPGAGVQGAGVQGANVQGASGHPGSGHDVPSPEVTAPAWTPVPRPQFTFADGETKAHGLPTATGPALAHGHTNTQAPEATPAQHPGNTPAPAPGQQKPAVADRFKAQSDSFQPIGRTFTYEDLLVHASGKISEIFGEQFKIQDDYPRQVRMPEPPLLLAHRVVGIDAEPGSMTKGTVWTETDVRWDSWHLNYDGTMPAGLVVEAGQADLFLISYLGADFENGGERAYRLLGCELTYEGGSARPGDTLQYEIKVTGHARVGKTRLFFFQYDGRINGELRLKVRNGQAGFFTDEEMANSGGVLWSAEQAEPTPNVPLVTGKVQQPPRQMSAEQVQLIAEGKVYEALGQAYKFTAPHTRTPRIQNGDMLLLQRVAELDPTGGPWGRGYMRVENDLDPEAWYLKGHFYNDPCMPGTLMCEGCLQAMSLYMIALGFTQERDGWTFEPVPGHAYELKCRGQVSTHSKKLTYEIFVDEIVDGPEPILYADILGIADGLKIFHGRRMGLRLVPGWPMDTMPRLLEGYVEPKPVATNPEGFPFDMKSLLACAWGKPTDAFGAKAVIFNSSRHIARLPGPPYHFMSRVTHLDARVADTKNAYVEVEYDVPPDAWYFDENSNPTMPFSALLEIALQPCGWLSVYLGIPGGTDIDLYFRNLDGTGTVHAEVPPNTGTLLTKSRLKSFAHMKQVVLVSFEVEVWAGETLVYTLQTGFGYFPGEAFEMQPGLPATDEERAWLTAPQDFHVDLRTRPERYCGGELRLADSMLLMIDEITGFWPEGGQASLGKVRGEKHVNPAEWFFKAHFFQDPVQPGSLGCEALLQMLQWWMIHTDQHAGIDNPRFEPIALETSSTWKYRGQITPKNERIYLELDVLEVERTPTSATAKAIAWVWVDGLRIYSYTFAMRIVSGGHYMGPRDPHPGPGFFPAHREALDPTWRGWERSPVPTAGSCGGPAAQSAPTGETVAAAQDAPAGETGAAAQSAPTGETAGALTLSPADGAPSQGAYRSPEQLLSATHEPWLQDHCPTYTFPSLPMMSVADMMAQAVLEYAGRPGAKVVELGDVRMTGWLFLDEPARLCTEIKPTSDPDLFAVKLLVWREARDAKLSRWEPKAEGSVRLGASYPVAPAPLTPITQGQQLPSPYETARIFHGPAFQLLQAWTVDDAGSTAVLRTESPSAPFGLLNQVLLDAAVHGIVHDELHRWSDDIAPDQIAYPYRVESLRLFGAAPTLAEVAQVRCETRFAGFDAKGARFPRFQIQVIAGERLWMELYLVEILMPMIEEARRRQERIAFIRDKAFFEGEGASTFQGDTTHLKVADLRKFQWLEKSMKLIYDIDGDEDADVIRRGVIKEHVSQQARVHPYYVRLDSDERSAWSRKEPLKRHFVEVVQTEDDVTVRKAAEPRNDFETLLETGRLWLGVDRWPPEDLFLGLMRQFVGSVHIEDPDALDAYAGKPKLFLANHQVQTESVFVPLLLAPLTGGYVTMIAKEEHRQGWIGVLNEHCRRYPAITAPTDVITYFDQSKRESMFEIMTGLEAQMRSEDRSVFLHVEGKLAHSCREPVTKMSSVFVDWALKLQIPIVPVRFTGGLPVDPLGHTLDFPHGYGAQDYWIGRPMVPADLEALPYAERRKHVMDAINTLGVPVPEETPNPGHPVFAARVAQLRERGLTEVSAVMLAGLENVSERTDEAEALLEGLRDGVLRCPDTEVGHWLASIARWVFGESGPEVKVV